MLFIYKPFLVTFHINLNKHMNKISALFLLAFYVFFSTILKSQNLGTQSFLNFGSKGWETISAMCTDHDGNYYVAGTFSRKLNINEDSLQSIGQRDIFLIKYNSNHKFAWAKSYGGGLDDNVYSLDCDNSGNIYMAGSFQGNINLGTTQLVVQTFTDVFYAQVNKTNGEVITAKALASEAAAKKVIIQTGTDGNIWLAGSFEKTLELAADTTLQAESGADIFFAKYSTDGNLLLHQQIGGDDDENLSAFVLDNQNNLYLGGSYAINMKFGTSTVINYGKLDMFVVKYDSTASRKWYKIAGGKHDDHLKSLSLDTLGNMYVVGDFIESTNFGPIHFNALKGKDVFIIKSQVSNGGPVWLKQLGGDSYNTANTIITAKNSHIYIAGNFAGGLQSDTTTIESGGKPTDAFIARYNAGGTKEWVSRIGGEWEGNLFLNYNTSVSSLFAYGYFSENLEFLNQNISGKNYKDIYFGQLVDCGDLPGLEPGNDTTLCSGQTYSVEGDYTAYLWEHDGSTEQSIIPEQSGIYSVTVTDIMGCPSTGDVNITIIESPLVDLGPDIVAPASDSVTLSTAGSFPSYLWTTGDTTGTITLQMSMFYNPGTVGLTVGAVNGCTAYDELTIQQEIPPPAAPGMANNNFSEGDTDNDTENEEAENIEEEVTEKTIKELNFKEYKIYPNPNNGKFFIGMPEHGIVKQVDIFDSRGNRLKTFKNIESNLLEIDVLNYSKGLYIIYISEEETAREFKIIYN